MNCEKPTHHSIPVVLLHGWKDDARKMERLARHLRAQGREVHPISVVPSLGEVGLDMLAGQLQRAIDERFRAEQKIDLAGFSMGGLVCRYYLQRLCGLERVRRFVTISTPHRGSFWAWFSSNPGCRQMRPGSVFLKDLEGDAERLSTTGFTSLWTPLDLMILPASSSVIPAARCRAICCLAHPLMVADRRVLQAVAEALE